MKGCQSLNRIREWEQYLLSLRDGLLLSLVVFFTLFSECGAPVNWLILHFKSPSPFFWQEGAQITYCCCCFRAHYHSLLPWPGYSHFENMPLAVDQDQCWNSLLTLKITNFISGSRKHPHSCRISSTSSRLPTPPHVYVCSCKLFVFKARHFHKGIIDAGKILWR